MAEPDVDTIHGAYKALARGDVPAVLGILDAGVEWHEPGGGNSPSGTFNGPDAVAGDVLGLIQADFDEFPGTGVAGLDTGFEHVFDMSDGKVVRFENKPGDAVAWAAGWRA